MSRSSISVTHSEIATYDRPPGLLEPVTACPRNRALEGRVVADEPAFCPVGLENREQWLDVVELTAIGKVLGVDPVALMREDRLID